MNLMAELNQPGGVRLRPPQQPADGLSTTQACWSRTEAPRVTVLPVDVNRSDVRLPTRAASPHPAEFASCARRRAGLAGRRDTRGAGTRGE